MTLHTNSMPTPAHPPAEPLPIQLVRKLVLLILLMTTAALGLLFLLRHLHIYSAFLPHVLSDAAMGLIAGLSARWILRKQTVFLRIVTVLAFLVGGLELLGWFTGWQIGLAPLKLGRSDVDWFSLGQLFLGAGVALLSLYAWIQPSLAIEPVSRPRIGARMPRSPKPPVKRPRRPAKSRPRVARAPAQPVRTEPAIVTKPAAKPKRRRLARAKPQLQLAPEGENRCPYCLEAIVPDDPRGTVECQICHTLHHADCWAITGACQVPHFTA